MSSNIWQLTNDQDREVLAMFKRHYSHRPYADGREQWQCLGPGRKLVLKIPGEAIFGWRAFKSRANEDGYNCAFFRNEGPRLSSDLIREADLIVDLLWGPDRHYTYVDAEKTAGRRSKHAAPGRCFQEAGWVLLDRVTKRHGRHILERRTET